MYKYRLEEDTLKYDDETKSVMCTLRCGNRHNRIDGGVCAAFINARFGLPIDDMSFATQLIIENWRITNVHEKHIFVDEVGKKLFKQGGFALKCCNYDKLGCLKEMFKVLNMRYTGKYDKPHLRAKDEILASDTWTAEEKAAVFDKKAAQRATRRKKRVMGLTDPLIISKEHRYVNQDLLYHAKFKGEKVELYFFFNRA